MVIDHNWTVIFYGAHFAKHLMLRFRDKSSSLDAQKSSAATDSVPVDLITPVLLCQWTLKFAGLCRFSNLVQSDSVDVY